MPENTELAQPRGVFLTTDDLVALMSAIKGPVTLEDKVNLDPKTAPPAATTSCGVIVCGNGKALA